jgi:hypothetical protein
MISQSIVAPDDKIDGSVFDLRHAGKALELLMELTEVSNTKQPGGTGAVGWRTVWLRVQHSATQCNTVQQCNSATVQQCNSATVQQCTVDPDPHNYTLYCLCCLLSAVCCLLSGTFCIWFLTITASAMFAEVLDEGGSEAGAVAFDRSFLT